MILSTRKRLELTITSERRYIVALIFLMLHYRMCPLPLKLGAKSFVQYMDVTG